MPSFWTKLYRQIAFYCLPQPCMQQLWQVCECSSMKMLNSRRALFIYIVLCNAMRSGSVILSQSWKISPFFFFSLMVLSNFHFMLDCGQGQVSDPFKCSFMYPKAMFHANAHRMIFALTWLSLLWPMIFAPTNYIFCFLSWSGCSLSVFLFSLLCSGL